MACAAALWRWSLVRERAKDGRWRDRTLGDGEGLAHPCDQDLADERKVFLGLVGQPDPAVVELSTATASDEQKRRAGGEGREGDGTERRRSGEEGSGVHEPAHQATRAGASDEIYSDLEDEEAVVGGAVENVDGTQVEAPEQRRALVNPTLEGRRHRYVFDHDTRACIAGSGRKRRRDVSKQVEAGPVTVPRASGYKGRISPSRAPQQAGRQTPSTRASSAGSSGSAALQDVSPGQQKLVGKIATNSRDRSSGCAGRNPIR